MVLLRVLAASVPALLVAIALRTHRGTCRFVDARGHLSKRARSCGRRRYLHARGTGSWHRIVRTHLPRGRYLVTVRVYDAAGNSATSTR